MGQQQVIVLLLVTVLVGLATIIAINTMQSSRQEANHDAIRQKMMDATTLAQAYYRKNEMMGGGGGSFQDIKFEHINIDVNDNELAEFSLESGDQSFTIKAIPVSGGDNIVGVIYSDHIEFVDAAEEEAND